MTKNYTPVTLKDVLASFDGRRLPPRPALITFDDAYASISEFAAPLCSKYGVPAVVFVSAACLDNRQLALDNLICHVANLFGLDTINAAIQAIKGCENRKVSSVAEVFARFLPAISLLARKKFRDALVRLAQINEPDLAAEAGLYLSSQQLRELARFNFEIGNHTYTHANCRSLLTDEFTEEIDQNRAVLEAISGQKVQTFSVPYGSSADLTPALRAHLQRSGYEAIFLAEGRANLQRCPWLPLDRVSIKAGSNAALFSEIEVLPRLRTIRTRLLNTLTWKPHRRKSDSETAMPTTWSRTSGEDTRAGAVPRETPGH